MKSMKVIRKVEQGFTLIELMIVVAIIGILAAVAIPQYQDYVLKSKWGANVTSIDGVKQAVFQCMNISQNDGTLCDSVTELNAYGFAGSALPTPPHATAALTLTGAAGKVTINFTGNAAAGSYIYDADCAPDTGGNMKCLSTATDTLPAKAGWAAGAGKDR